MSKRASTDWSAFSKAEKEKYLLSCGTNGGTASGFRQRIDNLIQHEPRYATMFREAAMEAATKEWQAKPREQGEDLFSIAGITIAQHMTRNASPLVDGEDIEASDETKFEKVHQDFATVNDAFEDATIKLRKAAQSSSAAEKKMRTVDEAKKRAGGKMDVFLKDIAD